MSTTDYIPPPSELKFFPMSPPVDQTRVKDRWILEIGPGKGEFILSLARENPGIHFVAVEYRRFRFQKICRNIERLDLKNLFIIYGDARECLARLFPNNFFEKIFVLFPDPWPKKRHAKHRLLKPRLIRELQNLLKEGGEILNATDAGFYSEQILTSFAEVGGFRCEATASPHPTYFEQKWKAMGRKIDYWRFIKQA